MIASTWIKKKKFKRHIPNNYYDKLRKIIILQRSIIEWKFFSASNLSDQNSKSADIECTKDAECVGIDDLRCVEGFCLCPSGKFLHQDTCIEGLPIHIIFKTYWFDRIFIRNVYIFQFILAMSFIFMIRPFNDSINWNMNASQN